MLRGERWYADDSFVGSVSAVSLPSRSRTFTTRPIVAPGQERPPTITSSFESNGSSSMSACFRGKIQPFGRFWKEQHRSELVAILWGFKASVVGSTSKMRCMSNDPQSSVLLNFTSTQRPEGDTDRLPIVQLAGDAV